MNFRDLLANDMRSISLEMGTDCVLKGRKVSVPVRAVISDEQSANGGYALLDGRTVSATAQFDAGQHVNDICVGLHFFDFIIDFSSDSVGESFEGELFSYVFFSKTIFVFYS